MLAQSSDRRVVADSESTRMERGSNAMVVGDAGVSVTSGPFSATDAGGTAVLRASQSVQIAASAGEGATLSAGSAAVSGGDVYVAAGSADPQEAQGGDTALQMGSGLCGQFGCAHGTTQIRKSGSYYMFSSCPVSCVCFLPQALLRVLLATVVGSVSRGTARLSRQRQKGSRFS